MSILGTHVKSSSPYPTSNVSNKDYDSVSSLNSVSKVDNFDSYLSKLQNICTDPSNETSLKSDPKNTPVLSSL